MAGDVARLRQLAANGADLLSCREPSLAEAAVLCGRPEAKQELRNRARELIAAKLDAGGDAEEAD